MGFLDKLLGRETPQQQYQQGYQQGYQQDNEQQGYGQQQEYARTTGPQDSTAGATAQDRAAIARYRYLLRTAPPEQIEEAHAQAFAQLSPSQRQQTLQEMTQTLPASERPQTADPRQMARAATRAEMQQPGYLQRTFGGRGYGMGGGMGGGMMGALGGSLLGTIAGVVIGTAVADALLGGFDGSPEQQDFAAGGEGSGDSSGGDAGGDASAGDASGGDAGAGDAGTDAGGYDSGGDSGWGGDSGFGGGDFGGGDFGGF
ncbi:MAG: hypothetical protein ABJA74_10105 [Lapillicoccus sp.]